jgi:hypothetical protein
MHGNETRIRRWAGLSAVALCLCGCGPRSAPADAAGERLKAGAEAAVCASPRTYEGLKDVVFDAAAGQAPAGSRDAVRALGRLSSAKVVQPVLDSFDNLNDRTTCSGQLAITLPPSAAALSAPAAADAHYTIQPSADGKSLVYGVEGAGPLTAAIAGADLGGWAAGNAPSPAAGPSAPTAAFNAQGAVLGNPAFRARMARLNQMLAVALARDVTGRVRTEQAAALDDLDRCAAAACVEAWFGRREAALGRWQE